MLRSWIDRLRIYIHPEQVILVRQSGLFKQKITAKQLITVSETGTPDWSGALTVLNTTLKQPEWQQASATVILSDSFAKYRIVPWNDNLTEEEKMALLNHQFGQIYGEATRSWQITASDNGFGKPSLVCAIDMRLIEAIQKSISIAGVRLTSIQPFLMTAFNHWRQKIDSQDAWLVFAEKSHLSIVLIQQGTWRSIRSQHCSQEWENNLETLLTREALQLGVDTARFPIYFFNSEHPHFKLDLPAPFKVQALHLPIIQGYSPQGDQHIAAALCT